MIELNGVSKHYLKGQTTVTALRELTLSIEAGEHVALVGPSGAGKSTLLYLLGLMDTPSSGELRLLGQNPAALSDRARSRLRGQLIGFVFQSFNLLPQLKAWQNVALPLKYQRISAKARKERALALLEQVGLLERAEHYPSELSGGQEQRVAIARALVTRPKLILADEPTGNLDSASGEQILALLQEAHTQGTTLIIVTHDPQVAARASRQLRLIDGQLVSDSS
jgi:putative ABC transport system ATP-binding protein